jgi:hypothetical protein
MYKKFEDSREFGKLFANQKFKRSYSDFINWTMEKLYKPNGNWGRLLQDGNYGVINTNFSLEKAPMSPQIREFYKKVHDNIDPKWSLLNYVNTHWTSFMHIINTINYWIDTKQIKNERPFNFQYDHFEELERLKSVLIRVDKYIFMPNDNLTCFHKIMGAIATTTYIGNLAENTTLESLSSLGHVTDVVKSKPGQRVDTHGGVDLRFKLDGVPKTLQCKACPTMIRQGNNYIFSDVSNPENYNVDFFSFVVKGVLYVFNTYRDGKRYIFDHNEITYTFDQSLLRYKLEL